MSQVKKNKRSNLSVLRSSESVRIDATTLQVQQEYRVLQVRELTDSTFVLRFTRNNMQFFPGQHVVLGLAGENQTREYSIYSSIYDDFLEVIIKEVKDGIMSRKFHQLQEGDRLKVDGPFGFFSINEKTVKDKKHLFIATGTGIAPFHSMAGSYAEFDYHILHGVRYTEEAYDCNSYPSNRYTLCTSGDSNGDFNGRVTDYLLSNEVDSDTLVYLCGNCDMIYEVYDLLTARGLDSDQIKTEVYF